jgi:hypothetical protein
MTLDRLDRLRQDLPAGALAPKRALSLGTRCIESRSLARRGRHSTTMPALSPRAEILRSRCPILLVQAHPDDEDRLVRTGWRRIWEGNRPRDKERYRLYVKAVPE